ncbi:MAG: hypothetical protein B7Z75_03130 [Acidocella sp. 20-57-95]|nr:MAG: hypothetical protein B7Z75_03130 [Acidocella sp. 20-57-95]OYV56743.1 MAG: hypothetical protein B7Z71_12615 [Acidocella sp. 21-58-7]HQT64543.1 DUF6134 family protein [Acidocella sp.]HQU03949.1 DUF6134 family protein [Acidocella sp.]
MDRRRFLLSAAAFALPIPANNSLAFKVLRNGAPIGEHHLNFTQTGDDLAVDINIGLVVTIASIPVFRYSLKAVEKWSGGVFQSLHSMINDNGTNLEVQAAKSADGYTVTGINHTDPDKSYPTYTAPPNTMPLTYWNKNMLNGTILNIQTAHSYPAIVNSPGWNKLPTAEGGFIVAQRFDVTGKLHLSVWYDQNETWSGLEFHVNGDESYQKITS